MLSRHSACRRAVQRSIAIAPLAPDTAWITDDVLRSTFSCFVANSRCNSKRHGSSVPGPLEARRRLAKRRMMELAGTGYTSAGIDIGALLGPESLPGRWSWRREAPPEPQSVPRVGEASTTTILPWWTEADPVDTETAAGPEAGASILSPPPKRAQQGAAGHLNTSIQESLRRQNVEADMSVRKKRKRRGQILEGPLSLKQALSLAENPEQVLRTATDFANMFHGYSGPRCGDMVLQKLRELHASPEVLVQFLANPVLNIPQVQNVEIILRSLKKKPMSITIFDSMKLALNRMLKLGLASEAEIQTIFPYIPVFAARAYPVPADRDAAILSMCASIWDGIQSSPVLPAGQLKPERLNALLIQLGQLPYSRRWLDLGAEIVKKASSSQIHGLQEGISALLVNGIRGWQDLKSSMERNETICTMSEVLNHLPAELARTVIRMSTTRISATALYGPRSKCSDNVAEPWIATVSTCPSAPKPGAEWNGIEDMVGVGRSYRRAARYLSKSGSTEICEFFMRYWIRHQFEKDWGRGEESVAFFDTLRNRFRSSVEGSDDPSAYTRLLAAIHQGKRSYIPLVLQLFRLLQQLHQPVAIKHTLRGMKRLDILPKTDTIPHIIRLIIKVDPPSAFWLLTQRPRIGLEGYKVFLLSLVRENLVHPDRILELLETNARSRRDHKPCPQLLHQLALAFAHAPSLTNREALRYSRLCYVLLCKYKLPRSSEVTRAMAHAGVTRYLEQKEGISTEKLRWILEQVAKVEGHQVARELDEAVSLWRWENTVENAWDKLGPRE